MTASFVLSALLVGSGPMRFERHDIDSFPGGYQVAVADVNRDGKPDVIALSTSADRVDWYENPTWRRRPIAHSPQNIDLAVRESAAGRLEIALASGFYFSESTRGGEIYLLTEPDGLDDLWPMHPVGVDPVVHRVRWGDLDGDGRAELVHAPIFGPGSDGARDPKPAHLWAFRLPDDFGAAHWEVWKIDETLTVLHGLCVSDLDGDGRDEVLTASFEGIHRFDFVADGGKGRWRSVQLAAGAEPASDAPGASRGSSEVALGKLGREQPMLVAIEPWHGNQVVVYRPASADGPWRRVVLDDTLDEGHALVVADFDGDGMDEIVAGWRKGGGGLRLYDPADASGERFVQTLIDPGIPVEGAVTADLNGDGKLDLVAIAGRSNELVWYENL